MRLAVFAVVVLLAVPATAELAIAGPVADSPSVAGNTSLSSVYPNPIAAGDEGEYVVLSIAPGTTLGSLVLSDGEQTVSLPNDSVDGRVVLTGNATVLPDGVEGPVLELDSWPRLANSGETLTLSAGNRTIDSFQYADAPEGERATNSGNTVTWQPLGATAFEPVDAGPTRIEAFALPDTPAVPVETLRTAEDRILLAGYTLSSQRVGDTLVAAQHRGVSVEVLVDGGPVGGLTNRSAAVLDRLSSSDIPVRVMDGPAAPYRFHHAKYAVVDDRAVVLTENWKPAGTGGRSSRGWGVVLDAPAVRRGLVEAFEADSRTGHTVSWRHYRHNETFERVAPSTTRYGTRFEARELAARRVELLLAPDNAAGEVEAILANATDSIQIVQVSIDGLDNRLLATSVDAARRGVDVDILLSQAWYTREENRALAANLTKLAARDGLSLSVRLADPNNRFEKIHAKGVIVDGEHVVLGSLNWNDNAFENNREVAVVLTGQSVADYYGQVFEADWRGGIWKLTVGFLLALLIGVSLAVTIGRKIEFAGG